MAARSTTAARKTTTTKKVVRKSTAAKPVPKTKAKVDVIDHAYIPDEEISHRYIGRKIWGVWDFEIAKIARDEMKNILLMGPTGAGKTLFGEAFAAKLQLPYYSLPCDVSVDPSSIFGRMQPTETVGKFAWQDGPATEVVRGPCGLADKCDDPDCFAGVLNVSEVNFMPPKISASLYPLLDGRRYIPLLGHKGEVVRAHKGLLIIADMNPNYRGTMELNAAFKNRFDFKIPWDYDNEVEERLVQYPTLRDIAKRLRDMYGMEIQTPVSTNMLMEFETFAANPVLSVDFATNNFVSAFHPDEQEAVTKVFELNKVKLEKDVDYFMQQSKPKRGRKAAENDDDLDEVEYEWEVEN